MKQKNNLSSIQALRGIAAILVVFCHSEQFISFFLNVHLEKIMGHCFGGFGVDIFFVISGFIMIFICKNEFCQKGAFSSFIIRRVTRIFPMYWITFLIVLAIIIPTGILSQAYPVEKQCAIHAVKSADYYLRNLLLIPAFSGSGECPTVGVAWTLFFEMFFYYVFSCLLFFKEKNYLMGLCFIFTSSFLINLCCLHLHIQNNYLAFYGNDIILEFIFGCIVAEQYFAKKMLTNRVSIILIILSVIAIACSYHDVTMANSMRAMKWGIPSAFIVYGMLSLEENNAITIPQLLIKLGDSSYSIYLTHLSIFLVLLIVLLKQVEKHISIPGDLAVFGVWMICILLGHLSYCYVEKPLTRLLKRTMLKSKAIPNYASS